MFGYIQLDFSRQTIRLIKVIPGTATNQIRVDIIRTVRDARPKYISLSYIWNKGNRHERVCYSDKHLLVERNLEMFLRRFRESGVRADEMLCVGATRSLRYRRILTLVRNYV